MDAAGEVLIVDGHAACPGHAAFVGSSWGYVDPFTGEPATARSEALDEDEDVAGLLDDDEAGEQIRGRVLPRRRAPVGAVPQPGVGVH